MIRSELLDEEVMQHVSANTIKITPGASRRSSVYLTKFEVARIVGERARQIISGSAIRLPSGVTGRDAAEQAERCTDPTSLVVDPVMVAKLDLVQRKIPMIVRRTWPDGTVENIPVNELLVDTTMLDLHY